MYSLLYIICIHYHCIPIETHVILKVSHSLFLLILPRKPIVLECFTSCRFRLSQTTDRRWSSAKLIGFVRDIKGLNEMQSWTFEDEKEVSRNKAERPCPFRAVSTRRRSRATRIYGERIKLFAWFVHWTKFIKIKENISFQIQKLINLQFTVFTNFKKYFFTFVNVFLNVTIFF